MPTADVSPHSFHYTCMANNPRHTCLLVPESTAPPCASQSAEAFSGRRCCGTGSKGVYCRFVSFLSFLRRAVCRCFLSRRLAAYVSPGNYRCYNRGDCGEVCFAFAHALLASRSESRLLRRAVSSERGEPRARRVGGRETLISPSRPPAVLTCLRVQSAVELHERSSRRPAYRFADRRALLAALLAFRAWRPRRVSGSAIASGACSQ